MKLFKYENYEVQVEPEALLLKPFAKLLSKHKKDKEMLKTVFAFIYFFSDTRSDYQIFSEQERIERIKQSLGLKDTWQPDDDIKEAIEFYNSFKTESALLLEDTRGAISKLREMLKNIDFTEVDDKGKPIYPLNTLTSTIKVIPALVKDLKEAEIAVNSEIQSNAKMRGGQDKKIFEDGINF